MTGIELIAKERQEQIEKHGYDADHDSGHYAGELAFLAEMLLASEHEEGIDSNEYPDGIEPEIIDRMLWKPYKEKLIIAGALIAAEIDRISNEQ